MEMFIPAPALKGARLHRITEEATTVPSGSTRAASLAALPWSANGVG